MSAIEEIIKEEFSNYSLIDKKGIFLKFNVNEKEIYLDKEEIRKIPKQQLNFILKQNKEIIKELI